MTNASGASDSRVRFAAISLDCADPGELADFYAGLLGGDVLWRKESSAGVRVPGATLVAQRIADYKLPVWPGASIVHLDLGVDEGGIESAQKLAVGLGATLADPQPDARWRVLLDPAGHPFCLTPFTPPS